MATEDIFVNVNATSVASSRAVSLTNSSAQQWKKFIIGDLRDLNLYFTDGDGAYIDVSAYATIRVGVGGINKRATGGTFDLTGDLGTQTIAFDANAAAMDTAITAAQAACTATTPVAGVWIVKYDAVGAQALPTTDAALLTPDSSISVKRLVTGDGSTKEEWIIRIFQTPWAYSESWSDISNGVTGTLAFATENLYKAMAGDTSLTGFFEVELTDASANVTTPIQAPVIINGEVIGDGVTGTGTFASYLTQTYEAIITSVTAETGAAEVGTGTVTWRMPYAMTLTGIRASVKTAPSGSVLQVDLNEEGSSVLSTEVTIDAGETTSTTAATPPVISDSALADDAEMTIDVVSVGSGDPGIGLKLYLLGYRA